MCDEIDIANDRIEVELNRAIDAARCAPRMPMTGRCYNCEDKTAGHFCDSACREDWIKRQRMQAFRFDSARFEVGSQDAD